MTSSIYCINWTFSDKLVYVLHSPVLSWLCFSFCRSNLKGLYRGDIYNVYNCQRSIRASRPALVCWMGYTSFTAAHICIGIVTRYSWKISKLWLVYSIFSCHIDIYRFLVINIFTVNASSYQTTDSAGDVLGFLIPKKNYYLTFFTMIWKKIGCVV